VVRITLQRNLPAGLGLSATVALVTVQRLVRILAAILASVCASSVAVAAAASGGVSAGSGGTTAPPPRTAGAAKALSDRGMWVWYVSQSNGGSLSSIVSTAHAYGLNTLMVKAGDGTGAWSQFGTGLVSTLHANGLKVCAWQYVYGNHPIFEAEVGAAAVHNGADCLLIDAEAEYEGKYVAAQEYVKKLRQLVGANYPVGLAGFPYVDYHPAFPYSVFLGPGGAQNNTPQMYWADIGVSVDTVYAHTYDYNLPYGRPIEPLGETSGNPPPSQIARFRQLSRAYGAPGLSWWDWQETSSRDWHAVGQPVGNLSGFRASPAMPRLSTRSRGGLSSGDLVVWAQEHLVSAGVRVTIDGSFGNQTQSAVTRFQTSHGLNPTGVVDPVTWQALLRYPPANVTWTSKGARASRASAGGSLRLTAPASARLRARRYEIPRHLGAG
jgi:Putative peptidoglycan binding domain